MANTPETTTANPAPASAAPAPKPAIVTTVQKQIESLVSRGALVFPADYSVQNALASAKLYLQTVQNKDQKSVVDANGRPTGIVTEASMVNAVFDMCVQGMNVGKKQGYFIVYGDQLVFQRSYFGDIALAQRVNPNIEVYSAVVYEGDDVKMEIVRGRVVIFKHVPGDNFGNDAKIIAAYSGIVNTATGEDSGAEYMTLDRIKKSWSMSKTYKHDGNGPHNKFPAEMCLRTVSRRRTKPIINSSSDAVLLASVRRQEIDAIEAEAQDAIDENANQGGQLALNPPSPSAQIPQPTLEPEKVPAGVGATAGDPGY